MAKVVGLVGSASGKVGNVVYAVANGIQIARVYQPSVSNPKSNAQLLQRAKGNMVGRLSGITPREAILGLGSSNRSRRAEYLRNALNNATATYVDGNYTAKIVPAALKFSKGYVTPVINIQSITIDTLGTTTVSYKRIANVEGDEWEKAGGYFVLVAIDNATGNYDFVRVYNWQRPAFPSSVSDVLTVTLGVEPITTHDVFAYFVPFVIDESKGSTRTSGLEMDASEYAATLGLSSAASMLKFGNTNFLGQAVPTT